MIERIMVRVLMVAFGLGALLDFFMAIMGMIVILQVDSTFGYVTCVVAAFALLCLRLCMKTIYVREGVLYRFILCAVAVSVLLDFYAISNSVIVHIIIKQPLNVTTPVDWRILWGVTTVPVLFFSVAIVLFLTTSPMALSYLFHEQFGEDEEVDTPPQLGKDDCKKS